MKKSLDDLKVQSLKVENLKIWKKETSEEYKRIKMKDKMISRLEGWKDKKVGKWKSRPFGRNKLQKNKKE